MKSSKEFYKEMGGRIRGLREGLGMSQVKLSNHLGYLNSHVSRMESGSRRIQAHDLPMISKVFGVSVDELLYGEEVNDI